MEVPGLADLVYDSEEQHQPLVGHVTSVKLPGWLAGSLYRIGPAKFQLAEGYSVNHWFDGLAMVVRFHVCHNQVTLQKRFIQTDAYKKAIKNKKLIFSEFGTHGNPDPSKGFISRIVSSVLPTDLSDNCFNNVYRINGQLLAAAEKALVTRIDANSLATHEQVDLTEFLGVSLCCSHPVTDSDGTVYTLGITFMPTVRYQVNRIPAVPDAANVRQAFGGSKCLLSIPSSWLTAYSFYHSFCLTENYIVLFEQPMVLMLSKVLAVGVQDISLKDCIEWHPEYRVKVYVVHKADGKLVNTKYITVEPFFQSHVCNAYEEGGQIVLDMITSEGPGVLEDLFLDKLRRGEMSNTQPGRVTRLVVPVIEELERQAQGVNLVTASNTTAIAVRCGDTITLTLDLFPEAGVEYPTINPRYRGRPYRYLYVSGLYDQATFRSAVAKLDMHENRWLLWRGERATFPSEATFVARPGGADEDDGVLLMTLLGSGGRPDQLEVLDARNMQSLARVQFGCRIPQLVHGLWVAEHERDGTDQRQPWAY